MQSRSRSVVPLPPRQERDPSDPEYRAIELIQRGRMILDVAVADLEAAERMLGAFHETTWHFRGALDEAKRSWARLRAEFGSMALESALQTPPLTLLSLDNTRIPKVNLAAISGKTYRIEQLKGSELAPSLWRLTPLPNSEDGPYYVAEFQDGTCRCDCADWTYKVEQIDGAAPCKHVTGIRSLNRLNLLDSAPRRLIG